MSLTKKCLAVMLAAVTASAGPQSPASQPWLEEERSRAAAVRTLSPGDCPYYPGHERLYVADPTEEWRKVSRLTAEVSASLPNAPVFIVPQKKNFIDEHIFAKIAKDGIPKAGLSSDEEFYRRIYLDLTGRIPSPADVRSFLLDPRGDKRERLVDKLVGSTEFVDRWAVFFGDLFQNVLTSTQINLYPAGRNAQHDFIKASLSQNTRYNDLAKLLITTSGDSYIFAPVNYIVRWRQPNGPIQDTYDNLAQAVGSHFLGLSLECISCHNGSGHTDSINLYLTSKTRYDFWEMASFFSRVRIQGQLVPPTPPTVFKYILSELVTGDYLLNTTSGNKTPREPAAGQSQTVKPLFILTDQGVNTGETYRQALARMLTADRQFARAAVNYIWQELLGIGIVEPAESFDLSRIDAAKPPASPWTLQPTHPELLEVLAVDFEAGGYDLRKLIKLIVNSSTYQLSSRFTGTWKDSYVPYFARKFVRRLKAEEVHDAIVKATNVFPSYTVSGIATPISWAMQLPDPTEPRGRAVNNLLGRLFISTFIPGNRGDRLRSSEGSITQALTLLNDLFVTTRVKATNNSTVQQLVAKNLSKPQLVEELYLATLGRFPTATEYVKGVNFLSQGDLTQRTEDLQFVLINKIDFLFNY